MNHTIRKHTGIIVLCLFTMLILTACGRTSGRFRLEGQFKNLNQGEFYLYDFEQGTKDTIAVNDGRFVYDRPLKDTITLLLLFPNYSELPIFAQPGAKVTIEGDVSHLRDTEVSGTPDNDEMTAFRLKTSEMMPPDVQKEARQYIEQHPASPISNYLLRHHILLSATPDYPLAGQLVDQLHEAQPQNAQLARLSILLAALRHNTAEGKLADFKAVDTKGDTITNKQLKGEVNAIVAWAMWSYDSQNILRELRSLTKEYARRLSVVSISLDASPGESKNFLERDSIQWPNICDSMLWQSPLLTQLGIATLPANILVDNNGNIISRNLTTVELKEKIKELLDKKETN
ncbi:MAG: AhpC/TSA family protein [Prevotella sp.]|nr:AhpC/TSA family protein [Prevotella sp.]